MERQISTNFCDSGSLVFLCFFTFKYPLQNQIQYNTRVCLIIGSLVFSIQIVLFPFLLFNTTIIVNEKATEKLCVLL